MAGMIASRECLAWASESPSRMLVGRRVEAVGRRLEVVDRLDQLARASAPGPWGPSAPVALRLDDGLGDLGLIAQRGRQDHPLGDLDRQLRLDVDRLACSSPGRSRTASGARAR